MQARKLDLSVAVVDKARFPRDKLCGGLVTGRCAKALRDIFGLEVTHELFDTNRNFEFFLNGRNLGQLRDVPELHLTMRRDLDFKLLDLACRTGVADYTGHRVQKIDYARNLVFLSDDKVLSYGCLIGADGVNSQVAATIFGQSFDPKRIGFALEIESPAPPDPLTHPVRIDFGAADWGYGWAFPKRDSTTIGIGGLHHRNPDMKQKLQAYLAQLAPGHDCKVKGHFLPFGNATRRPGRGNVLLVGDAAGLVDPITGEGIGHAIQSGAKAAEATARALREGQPQLASRYHKAATRPIRQAIAQARLLRPLIFAARLQPFFERTFRESTRLKRDYMRLLSGEMEYTDVLLGTAKRLPTAFWRYSRTR